MATSRAGNNAATYRRDAIVDAAIRSFQRWGPSRTRMEDIAQQVGIPRPHLYRWFPSKDALILEGAVRQIHADAKRVHDAISLRGSSRRLVSETLMMGLESSGEGGTQFLVSEDIRQVTARLIAESDELFDAMGEYWNPVLEYAHRRGELRSDIDIRSAIRWLTYIMWFCLAMPELIRSGDDLRTYLETFVVDSIIERHR
jgi:AcrR family transcriptional regulator